MTVAVDASTELVSVGDGTATVIQIDFRFLDAADLIVTAIVSGVESAVPLVRGVDYSVAGSGDAGGTVTPLVPIAVGTSWRIRRQTPKGQPASFPSGNFTPGQHETAYDRQALMVQELDREDLRSVKMPRGEAGVEIPGVPERKNSLFAFGESGELVALPNEDVSVVLTAQGTSGTAAGGETQITFDNDALPDGFESVWVNGAKLFPGDDYTISGSTVQLTEALVSGDKWELRGFVRAGATSTSTTPLTVSALPAGEPGNRAFVTDATATTFASVVVGGGANGVPVYHDGTNWRVG